MRRPKASLQARLRAVGPTSEWDYPEGFARAAVVTKHPIRAAPCHPGSAELGTMRTPQRGVRSGGLPWERGHLGRWRAGCPRSQGGQALLVAGRPLVLHSQRSARASSQPRSGRLQPDPASPDLLGQRQIRLLDAQGIPHVRLTHTHDIRRHHPRTDRLRACVLSVCY